MQQTKDEFLRMAFECLRRAARLLDAAGKDMLVIKRREEQRLWWTRRFGPSLPIKDQPPIRYQVDR